MLLNKEGDILLLFPSSFLFLSASGYFGIEIMDILKVEKHVRRCASPAPTNRAKAGDM